LNTIRVLGNEVASPILNTYHKCDH